jgi:hypothetical protein
MPARDANGALRNFWTAAVLASLLLHAAVFIALRAWNPLAPRAGSFAPEPEFIKVVFASPPAPAPPAPEPATPHRFTELPPDRADEAPAHADYLSNVASRARDLVPGGEDHGPPASPGRADYPQVAMAAGAAGVEAGQSRGEEAASPARAASVPDPAVPAAGRDASALDREAGAELKPAPPGEGLTAAAEHPLAAPPRQGTPAGEDPLADFRRVDPSAALATRPHAGAPGDADINQEGMASPEGNVRLLGNVSLNTTAWVYGFWMQRFRRAVEAHWNAPYAFKIGVIRGWTLVGLEVSRTGELLKLEVLDEEGHWSLRDASVAAIQAAAPFEPLPADAPEQTLRLQIRMTYTDYSQ